MVDKEGVDVIEKYSITETQVKLEINRFKSAVTKAKNELSDIIAGVPEELRQHAAILKPTWCSTRIKCSTDAPLRSSKAN
ncbi:MAG: hypothetical protein R2860_06650 [Desulfobacterales bacterium]